MANSVIYITVIDYEDSFSGSLSPQGSAEVPEGRPTRRSECCLNCSNCVYLYGYAFQHSEVRSLFPPPTPF